MQGSKEARKVSWCGSPICILPVMMPIMTCSFQKQASITREGDEGDAHESRVMRTKN